MADNPATLDVDRLADVVTELTDSLERLTKALDRVENERIHHAAIVGQLTDERFKSVTRG